MSSIKIKDLALGEEAEIIGYAPCDPRYRSKLLSMGLTKKTVVKLTKTAPLGDPVELKVRGFHLSLRKDEADVILVRRIALEAPAENPGCAGCTGCGGGRKRQGLRHRLRRGIGRFFGGEAE